MRRRQFLLGLGGFLLAGGGLVGGSFFSREINESFCITQSGVDLPSSIKIIIAEIPADDLCALKSAVPAPRGFGMVEVKRYLVPAQDWAAFIKA